jgi:hypothetical protein
MNRTCAISRDELRVGSQASVKTELLSPPDQMSS